MTLPPWLSKAMVMKQARGLPGVAAGLAVLLAAELLLPGQSAPTLSAAPTIPAATADNASDALVSGWGDTILARPLFSPSRRPDDQASATASQTLPRLSAIIVIGATRSAIFAAPGQKPINVSEGGAIDGYRVMSIAPNRVDLLGAGGALALHPQFVTPAPAAVANSS